MLITNLMSNYAISLYYVPYPIFIAENLGVSYTFYQHDNNAGAKVCREVNHSQ
jgi:hypothetical protein